MVNTHAESRPRGWFWRIARWFDSGPIAESPLPDTEDYRVDVLRTAPYIVLHLSCAAVFLVGWSPTAIVVAAALYALRMLAITGFYHRYFAHRSFETSRALQFVFALVGASAAQRGPIWWAAHHRQHHLVSETAQDPHSPHRHGFWWSHTGWFLSPQHFPIRSERVKDLLRYPELRFLDRFDGLMPAVLAIGLFVIGTALERYAPALGTSGWQLVVWGFSISTVALYHATFMVNSLAHRWGTRRYATGDESRNNWLIALLTFGEGWHNNHHHYPASCRQGFYWWELDLTFYFLKCLQAMGLVWNLRPVPLQRRAAGHLSGSLRGGRAS
jgi:stearoyl-CoA desaturase (delta-9 desaturase)